MRILLDTQVVIWFADRKSGKIGPSARATLANPVNLILVSSVSFWEIAVKVRIGRLDLSGGSIASLVSTFTENGFAYLGLETEHLVALQRLPRLPPGGKEHKDPFDHLIFTQSIAEDAALMSSDSKAGLYPLRELIDPRR